VTGWHAYGKARNRFEVWYAFAKPKYLNSHSNHASKKESEFDTQDADPTSGASTASAEHYVIGGGLGLFAHDWFI
jgi:hypothetical protein